MKKWRPRALAPGLTWTATIALVAWLLAKVVPLLGAPVLAILLGLAVSSVRRPRPSAAPGISFSSSVLLQLAIVLLGTTLALGEILRVGARSLPVMLGTLAVALAGAALLGRLFHLSQHGFGLWAGTAVNDTSSVVAAAYAFGHSAGTQAVVVKLTRTTLIIPIVLVLSARWKRESGARTRRLVPPFLILFVLASALDSAGLIGSDARRVLSDVALALITTALAGVGLAADLRGMRRAGPRPLLLGAILWVLVASTSLLLQALTGQL